MVRLFYRGSFGVRYTLSYAMVGYRVGDTRIGASIGMDFLFTILVRMSVSVLW